MKPITRTNAGMNLFELLFVMTASGVTFGTAVSVGQRFGWVAGVIAAPLTLAGVFALLGLLCWAARLLPHRFGGPPPAKQHQRPSTPDSTHVA